jgi:uncharacterized protein (DUF433 family)/transposase-like protein
MNKLYYDRDPRDVPLYSVSEAASYLQIPPATLHQWLKWEVDLSQPEPRPVEPIVLLPDPEAKELSFFNLVEVHLLQVLRLVSGDHRAQMKAALAKVEQQLQTPHPLTNKTFQTSGVDLLVNAFGQSAKLSRSKQLIMGTQLQHLLTRLEWDAEGKVTQLFPLPPPGAGPELDRPLMIDPRVSFGRPVMAGTGVPTSIVADLYEAGDSIPAIAEDYNCKPEQIAAAVYFESLGKQAA